MALSMQARTLSGATRALPVRRTAGAGSTLRSAVRGSNEWRRSPFTREDAVEAAWAVVDPVLKNHHRVHPYKLRSRGPLAGRRDSRFRPMLAQPQAQRDFLSRS